MPSRERRVQALETAGDAVTHEDCLAALNSPDPAAAFRELWARRSALERERVARALEPLR